MELNTSPSSLDNAEAKAAFKKPFNDTGTRHYRRRSPVGDSPSPEKYERSSSPVSIREDSRRDAGSMRRKDEERDRNAGRDHHGRGGDKYRQSDLQSVRSDYDNHRRDKYTRHDKFGDEEERNYHKSSSRSGRESRYDTNSDRARNETEYYKSKRHSRGDEKYSRDRTDGFGHRSRDNDKDERKEYRRGDRKGDLSPDFESGSQRDKFGNRWKEMSHDDPKELDGKRKVDIKETSKQIYRSERQPREQFSERSVFTGKNEDSPAKKLKPLSLGNDYEKDADNGKTSKLAPETVVKVNPEKPPATGCTAADIDAAKITAMKAAESVNQNLMGTGYMSADQKKKLLWGSKKSTPAEEQSSHRWDTVTFSDREQQEKFNKLMGVKVEAKAEHKPTTQQSSSFVNTKKQEEVQLDLEKQYVAGLRRRDGRTVGLGL